MKNFTLHDLPKEKRPRERLKKVGVGNLNFPKIKNVLFKQNKI